MCVVRIRRVRLRLQAVRNDDINLMFVQPFFFVAAHTDVNPFYVYVIKSFASMISQEN